MACRNCGKPFNAHYYDGLPPPFFSCKKPDNYEHWLIRVYVDCDCGDPEHIVRPSYFKGDKE